MAEEMDESERTLSWAFNLQKEDLEEYFNRDSETCEDCGCGGCRGDF